jgi:hypothetical protein
MPTAVASSSGTRAARSIQHRVEDLVGQRRPDRLGNLVGEHALEHAEHEFLRRPSSSGTSFAIGGSTSIKVRRALLFYALRRLGLDVPSDARPAHEQHIVLLNRAEVDAARIRPVEAREI